MADSEISVQDFNEVTPTTVDSAANVDTKSMSNGSKTVHRQVVCLGDETTFGNVANVTAAGALQVDGSGVTQPVSIASAVAVTDNSGSLTVDGTVAVSGTVTVDSELPAAAALSDAIGNPTTAMVGSARMSWDATNSQWVRSKDINSATGTTGTGLPASAGVVYNGTNYTRLDAISRFADADTGSGVMSVSNRLYNGSTWERARSSISTINSTGVGYQGVGILASFDDTSPTAITENSFGAIRMSVRREVYSQIRDAAGNERGANVTAGGALQVDGSAVAQPITDNSGSITVDGTVAVTNANLDAAVSTLATQTTLALIKAKTDNIDVALSTRTKPADAQHAIIDSGTTAVTNTGTFAVQDSEKLADNAGFTDGTTKVLPCGFIYDEVAGTALTENDVAAPRINANRASVSTIEDGSTRGRYATVTAANAVKVDASGVAVPITDNSGSITVDNAGTFAVQDSEKVADNAGFTDGTTKVNPVGFIFDETAGTALTENDVGSARMDNKRALVFTIEDETTRGQRATVTAGKALKVDASSVAVPITDNSGSVTVDNTSIAKLDPIVPTNGGAKHNTSYTSGNNVFSSDITPTNTPTTFRMYVAVDTASTVNVRRTNSTTVSENLNEGNSLVANASYIFDFLVAASDTINVRFGTSCTILKLIIMEVDAAA